MFNPRPVSKMDSFEAIANNVLLYVQGASEVVHRFMSRTVYKVSFKFKGQNSVARYATVLKLPSSLNLNDSIDTKSYCS